MHIRNQTRERYAAEFQRAELGNNDATVLDPTEIHEDSRGPASHNMEGEFLDLTPRGPDLMPETSLTHRHHKAIDTWLNKRQRRHMVLIGTCQTCVVLYSIFASS